METRPSPGKDRMQERAVAGQTQILKDYSDRLSGLSQEHGEKGNRVDELRASSAENAFTDEGQGQKQDLEAGGASRNHNIARSTQNEETIPPLRGLSFLDRYLVIWILLAMAIGILLGALVPSTERALQKGEFVGVSIPITIGLLVMMYPILLKVRYENLPMLLSQRKLWVHMGLSFVLNWIVAPLFMVALAWAFLPDRPDLRTGLIYVGVARCIAMVLVWNQLAGGDADYCAILVAVNSLLQIVLFAPLALFYVKIVSRDANANDLSYTVAARSVAVFLGIPLAAAMLTRLVLLPTLGRQKYTRLVSRYIAPLSLLGLLYTIIVLFASQGKHVVHSITSVLRVIAPLLVYFATIFTATAWLCYKLGFEYDRSCTQCFTAASNNFELAIAVVVGIYGPSSEEALASTVGPLVEVPVLVGCVYVLKYVRRRWAWQ